MSFSLGIIGLPNVGKSTLFKALTKKSIDIANYPFCTIDPNVGIVTVPDPRIQELARISKSEKIIPTVIEFYDIAGLVKNAHKGEGLGNKFLSHIREVKAIIHVVRGFTDKNIIHVSNRVDPDTDQEIINMELIFADLETVNRRLADEERKAKGHDKEAKTKVEILKKIQTALEKGIRALDAFQTHEDAACIKDMNLLTMKPMITVLNVDEDASISPMDSIAISAKIEAELADLSSEDAKAYLQGLGAEESGLDKLIKKSYEVLGLITFFTSGPKETRAWTIARGAKAPQAAGEIHTDFEKGFIRAEIISYNDFVKCAGEEGAKEQGKMRLEGKDYIIKDGDVAHFRFSV